MPTDKPFSTTEILRKMRPRKTYIHKKAKITKHPN